MSEQTCSSGADLSDETKSEMAKYGIKCAQISQFFYGNIATSLKAAIAEAKRHPTRRLIVQSRCRLI
jgi:hypothetical protein